MLRGVELRQAIIPTELQGFDLVAADKNLVGANLELVDTERREFRLRESLGQLREEYSFILIDCPPALDLLTLNALMAADSVLIPLQCEFFALEGISELIATIEARGAQVTRNVGDSFVGIWNYTDNGDVAPKAVIKGKDTMLIAPRGARR